jgi:hypothetical protein
LPIAGCALDTLQPTGTGADGAPVFAKVSDWRDLIASDERQAMLAYAQQNAALQQSAAGADALLQQRRQHAAEVAEAQGIAAPYVTALAADPTSVDVGAIARAVFPRS